MNFLVTQGDSLTPVACAPGASTLPAAGTAG
jgi:hypothetical protein